MISEHYNTYNISCSKHVFNTTEHTPSQYGSGGAAASGYYALPTSGVVGVVAERPPPLLYAHHAHAHTPHTPHTPHHSSLMYAPAQPMYLDMLKTRDAQHAAEQKKEPQVGKNYKTEINYFDMMIADSGSK